MHLLLLRRTFGSRGIRFRNNSGHFKILKVDKTTKQIEIVLMPRVDLIKVSAGKSVGQPSPIIAPIVAQLRLNRTGELQPSDKPPYVPRECLAPNQSDQIPFGKVSTMDEFIDQNPFNAANWTELTDYCDRMIASLLADKIINKKMNCHLHYKIMSCSTNIKFVRILV